MSAGILENNLEKKLKQLGLILYPRNSVEMWQLIKENSKEEYKKIIELFATFLNLMKGSQYNIEDLQERNKKLKQTSFNRQRNDKFLQLFKPIYRNYEEHLKEKVEIDFNDMIIKATQYLEEEKYKKKREYIIIDEFQDLSFGRYKLLSALKSQNPFCKIFAVGDDWQSIYRFAGSDIGLFVDFEKYFGKN